MPLKFGGMPQEHCIAGTLQGGWSCVSVLACCDSSAPMCTASGLQELSIQALNQSACNLRLAGWTRMHVCKMRT